MKAVLSVVAALLLAGVARAEWKDVKPGMDGKAVIEAVGMPLIQNRGRGGAELWTYDDCGFIQFNGGRVVFFDAPKSVRAAMVAAKARAVAPVAQGQAIKTPRLVKPAGHVVALRD
jgi:hypothetical protein